MSSLLFRISPRLLTPSSPLSRPLLSPPSRLLSTTTPLLKSSHNLYDPPRGPPPQTPSRGAAPSPSSTSPNTQSSHPSHLLGTTTRLPEFTLTDRTILVTGGARGLGLTQTEALLEAGATVYALDRLPEPSPDFYRVQSRAASELGTTLHYRQIDIRDEEMLGEVIGKIARETGRMDGLLAAAGIQQETPALEYSKEDADRMFGVNITGTLLTAKFVAREMVRLREEGLGKSEGEGKGREEGERERREWGGSMVFIASMSGSVANRGLICPAYNASKAGVIQLARNLASEWGQYGIRVNTISPGYIVTAMVEELFKHYPERRVEWPKQNMLGKLSYPQDYRGAAVFLLSDASRFMTGADLRIDGGHAAW